MYKSFEEAIAFAISRESEEATFYEAFATRSGKLATKSMFQELAAEEKKHKALLEGLTPEQLKSFKPSAGEDLDLSSIVKDAQFSSDMEYPEALRMAMKREEESIRLYSFLAEQTTKIDVKKLFDFLVGQEKQHKHKIESEYDEVVLRDY
jgi:rubrerythrin